MTEKIEHYKLKLESYAKPFYNEDLDPFSEEFELILEEGGDPETMLLYGDKLDLKFVHLNDELFEVTNFETKEIETMVVHKGKYHLKFVHLNDGLIQVTSFETKEIENRVKVTKKGDTIYIEAVINDKRLCIVDMLTKDLLKKTIKE